MHNKGMRDCAKTICSAVTIALFMLLMIFTPAESFTAATLADHRNVTVMEVTGNYDANNPDGSINADPRKAIAKEFYRLHKDEYDFLVIFSNFGFQMPEADAKAFYLGVKNDTQGIGRAFFDYSSLFGSNSKLQGTIDMGNITDLTIDPLDPDFEASLDILSHELMHRWGSYMKFMTAQGMVSTALLGKDLSHWSFLLNSYGSVLYGNHWQDNGNHTFTSTATRKYYSPLDLYLMGFIDKTQVPPMLLIDNSDIDPKQMPEIGLTISGTPSSITIGDIIAAEGERIPGPSESQKEFRTAFILITAPGTFTGDELYGIEDIRNGWVTRFSVLTDGKGIMEVATRPREDVPTNPGTTLPPVTTRTLPPNIEEGVIWLMNNQKAEGNWLDMPQTAERDTAEVALCLRNFAKAQQNYGLGLQWLNSADSDNTDYLTGKIEVMMQAGQNVTPFLQTLISRQNRDGGWGSNREYMSSAADTAIVLKAFSKTGYAAPEVIEKAVAYLKAKQNPDQGWGTDNVSTIQSTANVLSAFNSLQQSSNSYQFNDYITRGLTWLAGKQNSDGGFGNSPSTVYDTAHSLLTLSVVDISKDITNKALQYILSSQAGDGSWNESPYQTALAIEAVWNAAVDPDLSIKNTDIAFMPGTITSLPSNIVINAVVGNTGRTEVPAAKIALYEGAVSEANKIGEQTLAFPGQSSVNVTFNATATDGNEHRFCVVVDPENLVKESNESNNTALRILYPQTTYDFEIVSSDISLSANPVDIFKDVKITSKITNKGTMNAYNVQIRHFIDDPGAPLDIGTATVNIPAGATITNELIWKPNKVGIDLPLIVFADPLNTFAEMSEENNKAVANLTVNGSTEPNLTISHKDIVITPSPASQSGNANISVLVKNEGFSVATNIPVNFYNGVPGNGGILLGSQVIPSLNAGTGSRIDLDWTAIPDAGERIIYIKVDPSGQTAEISKDDNEAFVVLDILSLPDLAISTNSILFNPAAPKDGDTVSIAITVKNLGRQNASYVSVKAVDGDAIIGTKTIPNIAGNAQETVLFSYITAGKSGAHQITVVVDPDNVIAEQSDDNNAASRTFGVQNANLWLTEPYISPNGDNIKENTQFFFRLEVKQTVAVIVTNKKNEAVRTFSNAELENITGGSVIWNGLDDTGRVVADGQYQIAVIDSKYEILGSLPVVVDNNRSPISEAFESNALFQRNISCNLPPLSSYSWDWLPDESGLIFSVYWTDPSMPDYPAGIYFMGPDGEGRTLLTPRSWIDPASPVTYQYFEHYLAPDGQKIALKFWKHESQAGQWLQQFWVMDIDGRNLQRVLETQAPYILDLKWSPDGKHLLYEFGPVDYMGYQSNELWIMNADDSSNHRLTWGYVPGYLQFAEWSPEGDRLAFHSLSAERFAADNMLVEQLLVSDTEGRVNVVFTFDTPTWQSQLYWLRNGNLLSLHSSYSLLRLFRAEAIAGEPILPVQYAQIGGFKISPDRSFFALTNSTGVTIFNSSGDLYYNYNLSYGIPNNLLWSQDSEQLTFVKSVYWSPTPEGWGTFVYHIDLKKKAVTYFNIDSLSFDYSHTLYHWLSDSLSILSSAGHATDYIEKLYVLNPEIGEALTILEKIYLPFVSDQQVKLVSPHEHYITYYKTDASGVCGNIPGLWTAGSLLNLSAQLLAIKNNTSILLKGTAADLNFEEYRIEYADIKTPNQWNLIAPPSEVQVVNDFLGIWVPPSEGIFSVRLTVTDKAGNAASTEKRVFWGLSSSIANLYKSTEIFSPNSDNIKDTILLNYTVLEPTHLEFSIYDESNNLLRTFYKDHASPGADYITWDGKDEAGRVAPDGIYMIKIFDYEFFVELDNTPPDADLYLTGIKQNVTGSKSPCGYPIMPLAASMKGHAYDKNLKSWVIEYGFGDNPQEWIMQSSGHASIVKKDQDSGPITDSLEGVDIKDYLNAGIAELAGKKFRITVEDLAGNRSSVLSNMVEEEIRLYFHSWGADCGHEYIKEDGSALYPNLNLPMEHTLEGIETIGTDLIRLDLQYRSGMQWLDGAIRDSSADGAIYLTWDRSRVVSEINAVRLKALDIYGQEHYSNTVGTKSMFYIDRCANIATQGRNFLFENLTLLRLQIQSSQDSRFAQWTDYHVVNAPYVPLGAFSIAPLPELKSGMEYHFRMIGIGESGREYIGDENASSCVQSNMLKLDLSVRDRAEASCGLLSDGKSELFATLTTENLLVPITLKNLSYSIQLSDGPHLLRQLDLSKEGWNSAAIETAAMAEGVYPVSAVLAYFDTQDYSHKELSAAGILTVDRTLPEAKITYPGKSETVCPSMRRDAEGEWFAVPVEGIALDNIGVKRYELFYGVGDAPEEWKPALKRIIGKNGVERVPFSGYAVKGKLGDWYLEGIQGTVSLKLKVTDTAGNVTCYTTSFMVKDIIEISDLWLDKSLLSPNGDGLFDNVNVTYQINEYATVDLRVYPLDRSGEAFVLGQSPLGTIASGITHLGGEGHTSWSGVTDVGPVTDGHYGIALHATDLCGNTRTRWTHLEVDNTPPLAAISYPGPGDPVSNIIEIKGTASDIHFRNYLLEAALEGSTEWLVIANNANPVTDDILGVWNTFGLNGIWTLRLTGYDTVSNKNETLVSVNLGARKDLIKELTVSPKLFSPNKDAQLDTAIVKYEVTNACNIQTDIWDVNGNVIKRFTASTPSAGRYQFVWDGTNAGGTIVPDGAYVISLTAGLTENPSINQSETITVLVDTKAPVIDMSQPVSGAYVRTNVTINGSISDPNIKEYSVTISSATGTEVLEQGNQDRISYNFGMLSNLAEGNYMLNVKAKDLAENAATATILFTVDRTPPKVTLDTPTSGEPFGFNRPEISVSGSIEEKNLASFELRYRLDDSPLQWTELLKGTALPTASQTFTWSVGKNDNIPDGNYTLALSVTDKAGFAGEAEVKIKVDNTAPEISLSSPADNSYVRSALDIKGTAFDANLDRYIVELSEGACQNAFKWSVLMSSKKAVKDSILAEMKVLPADGNYCIKVSGIDMLGNRSEARATITIDTQPPSAPLLSGQIDNRSNVQLTWAANTESDLAGYNLYRAGKRINTTLIPGLTFLDEDLREGNYHYTIKAVDYAGNESKFSNEVTIEIDLTGPNVRLRTPQDRARVSGLVDVKGTAVSLADFKDYKLYIGRGALPSAWTLIRTSPVAETYGVLAQWDTIGLVEDEEYVIKLEAADINGNISIHQIAVTVDNRPPAAPVLLTALPSVSDVQVSWNSNTESDLAGYLLYRNAQLVNVPGILVKDLKPYLIATTAYSDKGLPDGTYKYSLTAMDGAGNTSNQSNTLEVTIDTRPPHATISDPADLSKFDKKIIVKAESQDTDISSIQFQYQKAAEPGWINLGSSVSLPPYVTHFDPAALGLTLGNYQLRAVATDKGGKTDLFPSYRTVIYIDITPPEQVINLTASVIGKDVTLTWSPVKAADLDGYAIYMISGNSRTKLNVLLSKETVYHDNGLYDGSYVYEVIAVDTIGNEGKPSNRASATIYTPILVQPFTPTARKVLQATGNNTEANITVQIFADTESGPELRGATSSDEVGNFTADVTLALGENRITAKAHDSAGNIGNVSDMVVIIYNEQPLPPTGLQASVAGFNVSLVWNANAEADISGYNLYRDGEKLNASLPITDHTVSASSADYSSLPEYLFDGNPDTSWISQYDLWSFYPKLVQIDLPSPELINYFEINWLDGYLAADFEIAFWSGYAWIPIQTVTGNSAAKNTFDISPSYRTDKIRIFIAAAANNDHYGQVGISEIKVLKDKLITETSYNDLNLSDGKYAYTVTAVDYYGFESQSSNEKSAGIGDVLSTSAPLNLTAAASESNVALAWAENTEPDLAGYNIYKKNAQGWPKINALLISETHFMDVYLPNGMHTYRVTAVDLAGNESLPSNEAAASVYVPDTICPSKPVLFFPTTTGLPVAIQINRTDISGFAEPGTSVTLFKSGIPVGQVKSLGDDHLQSYPLDISWGDVIPSPDGRWIVFVDSDRSLWLRELVSGTTKQLAQNGYSPVWSSDAGKIAFQFDEDRNGQQYYRIGIYDVRTGSVTIHTEETAEPSIKEYRPSISSDGSRIAFISYRGGFFNGWLKDLTSGAVTQMTYGGHPVTLKLSPDGKKLASIDGDNHYLYVIDVDSGSAVLLDENIGSDSIDWSPDSKSLLFSSIINGDVDVCRYDLITNKRSQITSDKNNEFSAYWSPDGNNILIGRKESDSSVSLVMMSATSEGKGRMLWRDLQAGPNYFSWLTSGGIAYRDRNVLSVVYPQGHFSFSEVQLEAGENLISAISTDSSGNVSQSSDEISVMFETGLLPDIETLPGDMYLYPSVPVAGQVLSMNIVVWNRGLTAAKDVEAAVYISDADGRMELLKSVIIPELESESGKIIGITWDTAGKTGSNTVFVILDPDNRISEAVEFNNYAVREFAVVGNEGVSLTSSLNTDHLKPNELLAIGIDIVNSGVQRTAVLDVTIEDNNNYLVTQLIANDIQLPYGYAGHLNLTWNSGSIYAGSYRVHALLRNGSDVLAENFIPFAIKPDMVIGSSLVTDRAHYGAKEDVILKYKIENRSVNVIVPRLQARVSIIDQSSGTELFSDNRDISSMLPGAAVEMSTTWNTGLRAPAEFTASIDIYFDGNIISSSSGVFSIMPVMMLSGTIQATPSAVRHGSEVLVQYSADNAGNLDAADLLLNVVVRDRETGEVMHSYEETADLAMNRNISRQTSFQTAGYGLKIYEVLLQHFHQNITTTIASTAFTVIDRDPPTVNIISPVSGSSLKGAIDVAAIVTDSGSGVGIVEYQIDSGGWKPLPVADPVSGRYSAVWLPVLNDEGRHIINIRAADRLGLRSGAVSAGIIVEVLTGTITATPDPVSSDLQETLSYSISNASGRDVSGLIARILVIDPDTGETKQTYDSIISLPAETTFSGSVKALTGDLSPKKYTVLLQGSGAGLSQAKEFSRASFEVKSGQNSDLETEKTIADVRNVLVLINDGCHAHNEESPSPFAEIYKSHLLGYSDSRGEGDRCHKRAGEHQQIKDPDWYREESGYDSLSGSEKECKTCIRRDLVERLLSESSTSHSIVFSVKDFQHELRSPYYTDIVILGNKHSLKDRHWEELREKVNSGVGLISSLWMRHGNNNGLNVDPILGVRHKGRLPRKAYEVHTAQSAIAVAGRIYSQGVAKRIEAMPDAVIAAWLEAGDCEMHQSAKDMNISYCQSPAIVLNNYGRGRTVFYAFDMGNTLSDDTFIQLSEILGKSLDYVHNAADSGAAAPGSLVPVKISLWSLGSAYDVKISESYTPGIKVYDPSTGAWVTTNPWTYRLNLGAGETRSIFYYALIPDIAGIFTLNTDISYLKNGNDTSSRILPSELAVSKDFRSAASSVLNALSELDGKNSSEVRKVKKRIQRVMRRSALAPASIEANILDILSAINSLLRIDADISRIRAMLDELLKGWESRYYFAS